MSSKIHNHLSKTDQILKVDNIHLSARIQKNKTKQKNQKATSGRYVDTL